MDTRVAEASYPLSFRQEEAKNLGQYLKQRQSVNLIGMKRVGISNFLRFFLYHKDTVKTYIGREHQHLFMPIDLNDLVEREIYPFWTLTLKRIVDACEASALPADTKKKVASLFLKGMQSQDLFVVVDNVRQALSLIVENDMYPTLFFLRFDRLKEAFNISFFDNLEGLYNAGHERVVFVFTSYKSIDRIFPSAKTSLSAFAQHMYILPTTNEDMKIIYKAYIKRFNFSLSGSVEKALFELVSGNVQYLQIALIILNEKGRGNIKTRDGLLQALLADERVTLESEELWESLSKDEKKVVLDVAKKQKIPDTEKVKNSYLWETGFIVEEGETRRIFSPLLEHYVLHFEREEQKKTQVVHLTRKEHLLFTLLESHLGEICEREKIIEVVWPEYREFGVSDWAIDRLVARVRVKLREQHSPYEIVTVRTRGYKLAGAKE